MLYTDVNPCGAYFFLLLPVLVHAQTYDLLIENGKVFDGAGNPWFYGDIAVRGDTIAAIGHLPNAKATLRIDAKGFAVAPGFIDIHSHGRRGIFQVPNAANYLHEGVTTIIEGPDGSSPVPLGPFLKKVSGTPISINFASFVGHGSLRSTVDGSRQSPVDSRGSGKDESACASGNARRSRWTFNGLVLRSR